MSRICAALACLLLLISCAKSPAPAAQADIAALAHSIRKLSPDIDPNEANRAAEIAYETSHRLAIAYEITDPPLIHNAKVNAGQRPRGLCYHWAEDMEARLNAEHFKTLDIARAIANSEKRFFIEHSTSVIVAKGAEMRSGIVIDPWRKGGILFWAPVTADKRYKWLPREQVLRARGQIRYAHRTEGSLAPLPLN